MLVVQYSTGMKAKKSNRQEKSEMVKIKSNPHCAGSRGVYNGRQPYHLPNNLDVFGGFSCLCDSIGFSRGGILTPFPGPYPPPATSSQRNALPYPCHPKGGSHALPVPLVRSIRLCRHHPSCTGVAGPSEGKRPNTVVALATEVYGFGRVGSCVWRRSRGTLYVVKFKEHR